MQTCLSEVWTRAGPAGRLQSAECRRRPFQIADWTAKADEGGTGERGRGTGRKAGPSSAPTGPGAVAAGAAARPPSGPTRNPWAGSGFPILSFLAILFFSLIRFFSPRRGEACLPAGRETPPPLTGRVRRTRTFPTGCAPPALRRAALHPRLHAAAPAGASGKKRMWSPSPAYPRLAPWAILFPPASRASERGGLARPGLSCTVEEPLPCLL
jgi:hypothetical protein